MIKVLKSRKTISILLCSLVCTAGHARTVYLNESFESRDRLEQKLPESAAWFSSDGSQAVSYNAREQGLTLYSSPRESQQILAYFTEAGKPVELAYGQTLRLTYEVSFAHPHGGVVNNNAFRIGLFDSKADGSAVARVDKDGQGGAYRDNNPSFFANYSGYRFDYIFHGDSDSDTMRMFSRNTGEDGTALMMLHTSYGSPLIRGWLKEGEFKEGRYRGEIVITRHESGALGIHTRLQGTDSNVPFDLRASGLHAPEEAVNSYDTIAFGLNTRVAESFTLHSVSVAVEDNADKTIRVGTRYMNFSEFTEKGIPVVDMWNAPMPNEDRARGAGFRVLRRADHATVWEPPTREDGAYNHYACLINFEGRFFAMWGNHSLAEDAPGQRVLFSYSDRWGRWSEPKELFSAPGPVLPRSESGIHLKPDRWIVIDDALYAVVYAHGAGIYPIAREVNHDGSFGEPFYMVAPPRNAREYPAFMPDFDDTPVIPEIAEALHNWYPENNAISWWARVRQGIPGRGVDGGPLIESFTYRALDGGQVLLLRSWGHSRNPIHNNRMYVSFNDGTEPWGDPYPTNIPDSPSRAEAVTLSDGTILLIGNQNVTAFDEAVYLDRDPITISISRDGYSFDQVYALRTGAKTRFTYPGVRGRNHGFAYSSSIVHDGWLYTLYSISKEDMAISRVRLSDMGLEE